MERVDRGGHQPGLAEVADVELDVRALDPDQRVEPVGLAPAEPAAQLVGVQRVGVPGVAGQVRHRGQLAGVIVVGLERQQSGVTWRPRNGLSSGRTRGPRTSVRLRKQLPTE